MQASESRTGSDSGAAVRGRIGVGYRRKKGGTRPTQDGLTILSAIEKGRDSGHLFWTCRDIDRTLTQSRVDAAFDWASAHSLIDSGLRMDGQYPLSARLAYRVRTRDAAREAEAGPEAGGTPSKRLNRVCERLGAEKNLGAARAGA